MYETLGPDFKLEEQIINQKAKFYVKELWGLDFNVPVKLNGRLKKTLGNIIVDYDLEGSERVTKINISKNLYGSVYDKYLIDDVLVHELCHWYCIINELPSNDGDEYFENLLFDVGSISTRKIKKAGNLHLILCDNCGEVVITKSSYDNIKKYFGFYRTKCCDAKLVYGGTKYVPSNYIPNFKIKELVRKFEKSI